VGTFERKITLALPLALLLLVSQESFATDYTPILLAGILALGLVTIFFSGVISLFGFGVTSSIGLALLVIAASFVGLWAHSAVTHSLRRHDNSSAPSYGTRVNPNEPIS
jgi:predicted RND superfamily exporter protein